MNPLVEYCLKEVEREYAFLSTCPQAMRTCKSFNRYRRERVRINDWIFRVGYELSQHERNCAVTLTYDNEHLPAGGNLDKRDYQLYMKSLRKFIYPEKVRYFGCGEYGSLGFRPHYHFIQFGYCPDDLVYSHTDDHGIKFYRSRTIADIWKRGFIVVCTDISPQTVPYLCKYFQKFNYTKGKSVQPFLSMSRRPGIGNCLLDSDFIDVANDKIYYRGKTRRIPRYYINQLDKEGVDVEHLRQRRREVFDEVSSYDTYMHALKNFEKYLKKT